jgi:hypothetical protein
VTSLDGPQEIHFNLANNQRFCAKINRFFHKTHWLSTKAVELSTFHRISCDLLSRNSFVSSVAKQQQVTMFHNPESPCEQLSMVSPGGIRMLHKAPRFP